MDEFTNEFDLARNFGFDITMPEGSMGFPGAFHQEYMNTCQGLYREFVNNMTTHIKNEKDAKEILQQLNKEKMDNLRFSLYRSQNSGNNANDPFARRQEVFSVSLVGLDSRCNTPWGLDTIPDEDEENVINRPHTAPVQTRRSPPEVGLIRPKTAGPVTFNNASEAGLSDAISNSKTTVVGVMDPKLERSTSRKITVGHHSFAKMDHGNVNAKLNNKQGQYIMKPSKVDFSQNDTANVAYDPSKMKHSFDPVNEKIALVRRITTFKSPTIASDMKINNRIPIQKNLKGIAAKRTTVLEIYQNARDRRARHFRIVTNRPSTTADTEADMDDNDIDNREFQSRNMLSIDDIPYSGLDNHSRNDMYPREGRTCSRLSNYQSVRENTPTAGMRTLITPLPFDESDLSGSGNQAKLKSILQTGMSNSRALQQSEVMQREASETQNGNGVRVDSVGTAQDIIRRPASRVAFARPESQQSNNMALSSQSGTPDVTKSTLGVNLGKDRNIPKSCKRQTSENSDTMSLSSAVSVSSFLTKMKKAVRKTKDEKGNVERPESNLSFRAPSREEAERPESKLSFTAPSRLASKVDTVRIIKQQMQKDKLLEENMVVWRRRMTVKSGGSSSMRIKKGNRLRLI